MQYKALISFSCLSMSMAMGDVREISDSSLANDLLDAGYIYPLDDEKKEAKKPKEIKEPEEKAKEEIKAEKPKTKRKGKKSDGNKDA